MPVKHKVVDSSDAYIYEQQLDSLVADGYSIIASNAYENETKTVFFALLTKTVNQIASKEEIEVENRKIKDLSNILHPKRN